MISKIVSYFAVILSILIIFSVTDVLAQDVPSWIKNNAAWWAEGSIDDTSFVQGIQYLIKEGIMKIPPTAQGEGTEANEIPAWIKNNAAWWAEGSIGDADFLNGIQYLVSNGIISVKTEDAIFDDKRIGGFDLSNAGPFEGKINAVYTIIMFSDHQCEKCVKWLSNEKKMLTHKLIESGIARFVIVDYPMLGEDSVSAAEAIYCAQEQGSYFEYLDILNKKYSGVQNGWASLDALGGYARGLSLDFEDFDKCLFWNQQALRVDHNKKVALAHGVVGTPTFFVVGPDGQNKKIVGAQPPMVFEEVIKEMS